MTLRLCKVEFHRDVKVQINDSVKTRHRGDEMLLLELGNMESFGRDHWIGIISKVTGRLKDSKGSHLQGLDMRAIDAVKNYAETLDRIDTKDKLEWVKLNLPQANIIKVESSQVADRSSGGVKDKMDRSVAVSINSAHDLTWK